MYLDRNIRITGTGLGDISCNETEYNEKLVTNFYNKIKKDRLAAQVRLPDISRSGHGQAKSTPPLH